MTQIISTPGLIGKNISYSLSPSIHNQSLKILRLAHPSYKICAFEDPSAIDFFIKDAWRNEDIYGFNVTQPYKNYVASLVNSKQPINTLYREPKQTFWSATSTDPIGFLKALEFKGFSLNEFDSLIFLGCGGAVQSIVEYIFSSTAFKNIPIVIIARSKRPWICELENRSSFHFVPWSQRNIQDWFNMNLGIQSALLVQGTNAEQHGSSVVVNLFEGTNWCRYVKLYFDLSYTQELPLALKLKRERVQVMNGLEMLVFQALESQKYWWGVSAEFQDIFSFLQNK